MKRISLALAVVAFTLSLWRLSPAVVEKHDNIGDVIWTDASFDLETGEVIQGGFWAKITGENIYRDLPPGVLTLDPYGTGDVFVGQEPVGYVSGVTCRTEMDGEEILIPWYYFRHGTHVFPPNPYKYNIGSRFRYQGTPYVVTGHEITPQGRFWLVKDWDQRYGGVYYPDEDEVPTNQ